MSIQIKKKKANRLNHSSSYGDWGLLSITTDFKLVEWVLYNSLQILVW